MSGRALPLQLEELKKEAAEEYTKANSNYERAKLDLQNLKRKKTGKEAAKDIENRIKTFFDKDRFLQEKRADFNLFLKEIGVVVEVNIPEKQTKSRKYETEIDFAVGIGMYDYMTNEYKGLNQVEDSSYAFGLNIKKVREENAIREERYEKVSRKVRRDIIFTKVS